MIWQDNVLALIGVAFAYSLIPQLVEGFQKKKGLITYPTSLINVIGVFILGGVYFNLGGFNCN